MRNSDYPSSVNRIASILLIFSCSFLFGASQSLKLVTMPTCGLLNKNELSYTVDFYPGGAVVGFMQLGLIKRLMVGVSYGGSNIVGWKHPDWLTHIGFNGRVRLFEESYSLPAFAIGFEGQGVPPYADGRYYYKSPGLYFVASKNYNFFGGDLSFHGGINYTYENKDDKGPDLFGGSIFLFQFLKVTLDYRLALDDNVNTRERGYLNLSIGFVSQETFGFSLLLLDMLENSRDDLSMGRGLRVGFVKSFK